jgi:hypothetical protein
MKRLTEDISTTTTTCQKPKKRYLGKKVVPTLPKDLWAMISAWMKWPTKITLSKTCKELQELLQVNSLEKVKIITHKGLKDCKLQETNERKTHKAIEKKIVIKFLLHHALVVNPYTMEEFQRLFSKKEKNAYIKEKIQYMLQLENAQTLVQQVFDILLKKGRCYTALHIKKRCNCCHRRQCFIKDNLDPNENLLNYICKDCQECTREAFHPDKQLGKKWDFAKPPIQKFKNKRSFNLQKYQARQVIQYYKCHICQGEPCCITEAECSECLGIVCRKCQKEEAQCPW